MVYRSQLVLLFDQPRRSLLIFCLQGKNDGTRHGREGQVAVMNSSGSDWGISSWVEEFGTGSRSDRVIGSTGSSLDRGPSRTDKAYTSTQSGVLIHPCQVATAPRS